MRRGFIAVASLAVLLLTITPPAGCDVGRRHVPSAGVYPYHYKIHPFMHGKIRVPIKVSPADGGTGTVFTNTLSAASRAGYSFDVQNKVGTTGIWNTWKTWKTEVTSLGVT